MTKHKISGKAFVNEIFKIILFTVTIERKRHPFKCITFGASKLDERHPATGDFDGNINVWDIENKLSGKRLNLL